MDIPSDYVYLDWAATAPLSKAAKDALVPYLETDSAALAFNMNANSLHSPGRAAFASLEAARKELAVALKANRPSAITFTSGSTESNNTALRGLALAAINQRVKDGKDTSKLRIITSSIEHPSVLQPLKAFARECTTTQLEVVQIAPDKNGFITEEAVAAAIDENTILVSIQWANSEVGSVQPVEALAKIAASNCAYFHCDATQALGKVPIDFSQSAIDAASFSGHKIGAPKGIGALYVRPGIVLPPFLYGGGQESGLRSGTQNVAGAAAFAAAATEAINTEAEESQRLGDLRDWLYAKLSAMDGILPTVECPAGSKDFLPNIVAVISEDFESQTLILRLDAKGFGVSGGSACSSSSLEASKVLRALGFTEDEAYGELRISMGSSTTKEDLERFLNALTDCLH